jgi:hypothetical protein
MKNNILLFALWLGLSSHAALAQDPNASRNESPKIAAEAGRTVRIPVVFFGGHETDPRDHGRPVVLIAAALGVAPEIFRAAFRQVHPADPAIGPTGAEARKNKAALLGALGKHGVTNERLDTVSNYYRYDARRHQLWPTKPAVANALVRDGVITGYELVSGGSGYSSPPIVAVPNFTNAYAQVKLAFGPTLAANGAVSAILFSPPAH